MAFTQHTISSVKHGSTVINGIASAGFSPGLVELALNGSGQIETGFIAALGAAPELAFSTTAVGTALTTIQTGSNPMNGIAITGSNFLFFYEKIANQGTRTAGSTHVKATVAEGMIIPISIEASHYGAATASYRVIMTSADGTTAPVAFAAAQALDAGIAVASELFTLGPVAVNGTTLDGVSSVSINYGNNAEVTGGDGNPYPEFCAITTRRPAITIATTNLDDFVSWGLIGQAQDASDSVITLQAVTNDGTLTGSGDKTFTIDAGRISYRDINGADGSRIGASITITPRYDGTNEVIVIA
jgi:hypothetical protein